LSSRAIGYTLLCFLSVGNLLGVGPPAQTVREAPRKEFSSAYKTALRLLAQKKPGEALAEIDRGLERSPTDSSLHNLRGLALSDLGRLPEAEVSFRNVIRLQPKAAIGYGNLAALFEEMGRSEEAVAFFREAVKREPTNPEFLVRIGSNLAALARYSEAAPYLEKAWAARPRDFRTGYEYARILLELKMTVETAKVLRSLTPPSDPALAARFHALSARVAEERGDNAAALRSYRRAYQLDPEFVGPYIRFTQITLAGGDLKEIEKLPRPPSHLSTNQHFALGLLFASHGASRQAVTHFEAVLRQEPENYEAGYNLTLAYRGVGQTEQAIAFLRKKIEREPSAELVNLLASIEEEAGNQLEAVRYFQRAVEMDPHNEQYNFDLGAEYLTHFTLDPALEVFRVGTQRFPKSARQYLGLGIVHFALRQYADAARAFLTALEIDPSSPGASSAWYSLGPSLSPIEWEHFIPGLKHLAETHPAKAEAQFCYGATLLRVGLALGKGEWLDESESGLTAAVRLKPGLAEAHLELGALFAARKQEEKALQEFLEAIRLDPNSVTGHYRLGQTYRNLGRLELAQEALSRYAQLTRSRNERVTRSRQAVRQFIISESEPKSAPIVRPAGEIPR